MIDSAIPSDDFLMRGFPSREDVMYAYENRELTGTYPDRRRGVRMMMVALRPERRPTPDHVLYEIGWIDEELYRDSPEKAKIYEEALWRAFFGQHLSDHVRDEVVKVKDLHRAGVVARQDSSLLIN